MNNNNIYDTTYNISLVAVTAGFTVKSGSTSLSVFLGLIDIVVVNAFIVYREVQKQRGEAPAGHAEFLQILQAQLLQTTSADFADEVHTTCFGVTYGILCTCSIILICCFHE
ncbi:hypothetical protein PHMEG_00037435 [Phytophthora megakarya]|uniref:Uncharacterized protein n=1 Tax=Phytophthora megakarya TaxID=4795 RepID=A0A225UJJ5_9STRA|nr:hypothetical protein PHMEG_00037435 [Phytophthora megakarya]